MANWRDAPNLMDYAVSDGSERYGSGVTVMHRYTMALTEGKPHGIVGSVKCGVQSAWFECDPRARVLPCGTCFPDAVNVARLGKGQTSKSAPMANVHGAGRGGAGHNRAVNENAVPETMAPGQGPTPVTIDLGTAF